VSKHIELSLTTLEMVALRDALWWALVDPAYKESVSPEQLKATRRVDRKAHNGWADFNRPKTVKERDHFLQALGIKERTLAALDHLSIRRH